MRRFRLTKLHPRWRTAAHVVAFALLTTLSHPRYNLHFLGWIALVPLLLLVRDAGTWRRAAGLGWIAGFLSFLGTIGWLYILGQHTGIGLPWGWAVAGFGAALLAAYLAAYVSLFSALTTVLLPRQGWLYVCGVPFVWAFCEWLRSWVITGFPWAALGGSQWNNLLIAQLASLGGVPLISVLLAAVNVAVANGIVRFPSRSHVFREALPAVCAVAFAVIYGVAALTYEPKVTGLIRVAVVPGNIPQKYRWERGSLPEILAHYLERMEKAAEEHPDLIVLPETSVLVPYLSPENRARFLGFPRAHKIPLLFGTPTLSRRGTLREGRNTVILIDSDGRALGDYHKQHLVPFGEYIPLRDYLPKFLTESWIGVADWGPGEESRVLQLTAARSVARIGVPICFESVFPDITREFVQKGANVLAVLTNDGWFGDTSAIPQHAAFSVFRAIEARRAVVRAANRGTTCFIDPHGRIGPEQVSRVDQDGIVVASVPLVEGRTPYAAAGDWASYVAVLATLAAVARRVRLRRGERSAPGPAASERDSGAATQADDPPTQRRSKTRRRRHRR